MTNPQPQPAPDGDFAAWQRVADELRACQERQQRDWGGIDSAELGRYLAGEADEPSAARIEHALEELPELRRLTDLVREVLTDASPVPWDEPPPAPAPAEEPTLLRFAPRPARRPGVVGWLRKRSSLVAAACLLIVLAAAMPQMRPLAGLPEGRLAVGEGRASRSSHLAADAAPMGGAQNSALVPLSREPRAADLPGLPAVAFDATKRGFNYLRKEGDLTRAAPPLARAVAYCQNNLKPDDAATTYTVRQLADVYQVALNTEAPTALRLAPAGRGKEAAPLAAPPPTDQVRRESANALREQLASKPIREVRAKVTPVLADALRVAPDPAERRRLVRALARLGPAADQAVPALTTRLNQTTDPTEARLVIDALDQIGPAGRAALPVLARLGGTTDSRAFEANEEAKDAKFKFHFHNGDRQRAAEVYGRLSGRSGRVGVHDRAGVFTVRAGREANRAFRDLARRGEPEVLVETAPGAPGADPVQAPDRALVVRIYLEGPAVRAAAGKGLKDGARLADQARQRVLGCCQKEHYDRALRELEALVRPAGPGQPR